MAQIALMIPRKDGVGPPPFSTAPGTPLAALPFVPGESQIYGYDHLILLDSVGWQAGAETATSPEGRRTVQSPKLGQVKLHRKVDLSTSYLTQAVLTQKVNQFPWEIYFLKPVGGQDGQSDLDGHMQARFMTVKLYMPLITAYSFDAGEGEAEEDIEVSVTAIEWIYEQVTDDQQIEGHRSLKYDIQQGQFT